MSRSRRARDPRASTLAVARLALVLACVGAAMVRAQEPPADALTLEQALALARERDPSLVAARLRRPIDVANRGVAGERPNPEARYEHTNELPRDLFTLAQPLELGGKRKRRIEAADAALRAGEAELAQAVAQSEIDTRRAYYTVASAQRRRAIALEIQDLAARSQRVASEREQVGDVSRLEVLQADLVLDAIQNEATALEGELTATRAELNLHVGLPLDASTRVAEDLAALPPPGELEMQATTALAVVDSRIAESEAKAALARAQQSPDITVEGTLSHGAEPEFTWGYHAAVAVVVPLFTRHTAGVQLEEATLAQLRAQRATLAGQVQAGAFAARARAEAARKAYLQYRDVILPDSRKVEAMAEESYRAGQTGLPALLEALRAARELRQRELAAATDFESALADLQQALRVGPRP
jgi:cobalt-zinc-cadmium efflux system outer membrane protein